MAHRELTTGLRRCRERHSELCARGRKVTPQLRTAAHQQPITQADPGDPASTAVAGGTGPERRACCPDSALQVRKWASSMYLIPRYCKSKLCWPKFHLQFFVFFLDSIPLKVIKVSARIWNLRGQVFLYDFKYLATLPTAPHSHDPQNLRGSGPLWLYHQAPSLHQGSFAVFLYCPTLMAQVTE